VVVDVIIVLIGGRLAAGLLAPVVPTVLTPVFVGVGLLAVYLLLVGAPMRLLVRDLELRVAAREAESQNPEEE
jgi:hypothetical protein